MVATLIARDRTVAAAESLTAGLLAAVLAEIPGVSATLRGGIVCYATDLKSTLVGVDPDLLARRGAVDPEVARQLARGVRIRCSADIGIGLTGVAGPDPQDGIPPGTVFVAADLRGPRTAVEARVAGCRRADRRADADRLVRVSVGGAGRGGADALGLLEQLAAQ